MSKRAGSTVDEVKGSHAVYVSQPKAVAAIIAKAANVVALATQSASETGSDCGESHPAVFVAGCDMAA